MEITNQLQSLPPAPLRVFIVENSRQVLECLEEMVGSIAGVRFAGSAGTADSALRGIADTRPDAVILDVRLAQGSGFDVLRGLQAAALPTEVYMLTNLSTEPYRRMAQRLGAAAFFDKSSQTDDMRALLAQRAAQRNTPSH
jgi:DNA-binding NarL/FixJ family response regulator